MWHRKGNREQTRTFLFLEQREHDDLLGRILVLFLEAVDVRNSLAGLCTFGKGNRALGNGRLQRHRPANQGYGGLRLDSRSDNHETSRREQRMKGERMV